MATAVKTDTIYDTKWSLATLEGEPVNNNSDPMMGPEMPYFTISQDGSFQGRFGPLPIRGDSNVAGNDIEFILAPYPRIWPGETVMRLVSYMHAVTRFTLNDSELKLYNEDKELAGFKGA
ncbi:META domain-containing protein [Chitinophaga flava]|uniref:Lipocalin-like domain-containing protein n=1 Tax=Chitinophaga flava TaxID=2259036 RepID=A0A365XSN6_9BACT|nr:hypothetical protein [Chitinophaga flava]RBL89372.1 hypothetical protein DF182_22895 [Chitinophaga flava]